MSNKLSTLRAARNLSKSDLAKMCGCSRVHIHDLELGKRQPSLRLFMDLGRALELSSEQLSELGQDLTTDSDSNPDDDEGEPVRHQVAA